MANRSLVVTVLLLLLFPALSQAQNEHRKLALTSLEFRQGEFIPARYTCDDANINPPFTISWLPAKAKSLALIMEDPDAPAGVWVHWIVYNIRPRRTIYEDTVPGKPGKTDSSEKGLYAGPCPPSGTHHYHFKLYALDTELSFSKPPVKEELEKAMQGHILDKTDLMGLYRKGSK